MKTIKEIVFGYRSQLCDAEITTDIDIVLTALYEELREHHQEELDTIAAEMEADDL